MQMVGSCPSWSKSGSPPWTFRSLSGWRCHELLLSGRQCCQSVAAVSGLDWVRKGHSCDLPLLHTTPYGFTPLRSYLEGTPRFGLSLNPPSSFWKLFNLNPSSLFFHPPLLTIVSLFTTAPWTPSVCCFEQHQSLPSPPLNLKLELAPPSTKRKIHQHGAKIKFSDRRTTKATATKA